MKLHTASNFRGQQRVCQSCRGGASSAASRERSKVPPPRGNSSTWQGAGCASGACVPICFELFKSFTKPFFSTLGRYTQQLSMLRWDSTGQGGRDTPLFPSLSLIRSTNPLPRSNLLLSLLPQNRIFLLYANYRASQRRRGVAWQEVACVSRKVHSHPQKTTKKEIFGTFQSISKARRLLRRLLRRLARGVCTRMTSLLTVGFSSTLWPWEIFGRERYVGSLWPGMATTQDTHTASLEVRQHSTASTRGSVP